jgi:hypothetical protein
MRGVFKDEMTHRAVASMARTSRLAGWVISDVVAGLLARLVKLACFPASEEGHNTDCARQHQEMQCRWGTGRTLETSEAREALPCTGSIVRAHVAAFRCNQYLQDYVADHPLLQWL